MSLGVTAVNRWSDDCHAASGRCDAAAAGAQQPRQSSQHPTGTAFVAMVKRTLKIVLSLAELMEYREIVPTMIPTDSARP